uniref:Protein ABIL2-like n=1 Tax=Davidia involucrata TaxID=16924 RepID=A0A5B6ZS16_DAVIN
MESETSSCSVSAPQEASNYDELFMRHSLLFADSLKDLKNLRKQLYSAAEYFEQSYCKDDHKQLVVETLKDYVTKALISTVDHLGSVAYKVNNLLDEKVDEVSETKLRLSCIEQRFRTCQAFIDCCGISQQSLAIKTPKYHRRYIIPVGGTMHDVCRTKSVYDSCILSAENNLHQSKNATQTTIVGPRSSLIRKGHSRLPCMESFSSPVTFSFSRSASSKGLEKWSVSPVRFPLKRSGSLVSRSVSPNPSNAIQRYPSEPPRSVSLFTHAERDRTKEMEQYSKKSRRLFKALLSMHKSKKDGI